MALQLRKLELSFLCQDKTFLIKENIQLLKPAQFA